ncbi:hypothetical protein HD806DRAFT_413143 [Xylariaceae sp. AK1471]|nr:hypothetical protein HD806DRAFT_413143 [Xylariaceae sp. AK1471]
MVAFTALNGGELKRSEDTSGSPTVRYGGSENRPAIHIVSQETQPGPTTVTQIEQGFGSSLKRLHY